MTKDGMKVLDSDMHLMEPVDLWERYIDARYKADAPRGLTSDNVRDLRLGCDGFKLPRNECVDSKEPAENA